MKFTILTTKSVFDPNRDYEDENYISELTKEQFAKEKELGIDHYETVYRIRFGTTESETTIDEAIECLALKDGADLIQFPNGNIGYVGYYNGFSLEENSFEILGEAMTEEEFIEAYTYNGDCDRCGFGLEGNCHLQCTHGM